MPRHILYFSTSSDELDCEQQKQITNKYLSRIVTNGVIELEKPILEIKSAQSYLLSLVEPGDTLIVSEFSQLGSSMNNLYKFVRGCRDKGIYIVQAKDGITLSPLPDDIDTTAILSALKFASEIENRITSAGTKAGIEPKSKQLKEKGFYYNKRGERKTTWGNPRLYESKEARAEGSRIHHTQARLNDPMWQQSKIAANQKARDGKTLATIAKDLNEQGLRTRRGNLWDEQSVRRLLRQSISSQSFE